MRGRPGSRRCSIGMRRRGEQDRSTLTAPASSSLYENNQPYMPQARSSTENYCPQSFFTRLIFLVSRAPHVPQPDSFEPAT